MPSFHLETFLNNKGLQNVTFRSFLNR